MLRHIKKKDRRNLNYQLAKFDSESVKMIPEVKLRQTRSRIYITDSIASLATITLDEVTNLKFPFQRYTEMELELNEVRYTRTSSGRRKEKNGTIQREVKKWSFGIFSVIVSGPNSKI